MLNARSLLYFIQLSATLTPFQQHNCVWCAKFWPCRDAHVTAVTSCCFMEGQSMVALTADSRGRLVFHNVSGYLSLTAMLAGAAAFLVSQSRATSDLEGALHPCASQRRPCTG